MDKARFYRVNRRPCRATGPNVSILENPMHTFSAIQIGHRIYVVFAYVVNLGWEDALWVLDTQTMKWNTNPSTLYTGARLHTTSAAAVNDSIIVVGVTGSTLDNGYVNVIRFDTVMEQWSECDLREKWPLGAFESFHRGVFVEQRGEMFFFSTKMTGILAASMAEDGLESVQALDLTSMHAYTLAVKGEPPDSLLPNFCACSTTSRVFLFGGAVVFGPYARVSDVLYILNVGGRHRPGASWSRPLVNRRPAGRWGASLTYVHGRLFLLGGRDHEDVLRNFSVYDEGDQTWTVLGECEVGHLPMDDVAYTGTLPKLLSHSAVATCGKIYVLGGDTAGSMCDVLEIAPGG